MSSHLHLFLSDSSPRVTSDLLQRKDAPIINLHITCFTDVTCVGVGIPHAVADAPGICIILRAWTSVLAGDFLPPPLLQEDPLADFGDPLPKTRAEMEKHRQGNEELVPALEYLAKGSMLFLGPGRVDVEQGGGKATVYTATCSR